MDDLTPDEMLTMLKQVRDVAWISLADDRTVAEKDKALREIQVITRRIGNNPPEDPEDHRARLRT